MNRPDDPLLGMLTRLQLTALRDQLDSLLDDAARRELNLREALTFLCQAECSDGLTDEVTGDGHTRALPTHFQGATGTGPAIDQKAGCSDGATEK